MDLSDIRKKIDDIDSKLLPLFLERMNISKEVAEYKKANGLPVLNKQRERDILKWVRAESGDMELYSDRLYNTIFELSRSYQDSILADASRLSQEIEAGLKYQSSPFPTSGRIACQGVEGAYGQMAADKMFPRGDMTFFKTFEGVFDAVLSGLCDFGVLPVENSSNGSVHPPSAAGQTGHNSGRYHRDTFSRAGAGTVQQVYQESGRRRKSRALPEHRHGSRVCGKERQ